MADETVTFAYLEAGAKSTPVALDPSLDTGKPETVWLFNLARDQFIEYRRDIVQARLRDFKSEERQLRQDLEAAFAKARNDFQGSGARLPATPPTPPPATAPEPELTDDALLALDPDTVADLDEELE